MRSVRSLYISTLVFSFVALSFITSAVAQGGLGTNLLPHENPKPPITPSPSPSPLDFKIGRLFEISNKGLMTKIMRSDPTYVSAVSYIIKFTEYIEQSAQRILRDHKMPQANQLFRPCNHDGAGFKKAFVAHLQMRHLPVPDISCMTQFVGVQSFTDEAPRFDVHELISALRIRTDRLYENRKRIADVILDNSTEWNPDVGRRYSYNTTSKRCIVNHVPGLRIGTKWYLRTSITNEPSTHNLALLDRKYMTEYMRAEDGKLVDPLKFRLHLRPPDGDTSEHVLQNATTTSISSTRGASGPGGFQNMIEIDIPAYVAAVDMSDLSIQQAQDALTPSSLAILLLPLALNLVPVALLAQVSSVIMLMYTLMSDVVTVIPLATKGVELIYIGKGRHAASSIRLSGAANGSLSESAVMELWTAECRSRDNVLPAGIAFVVLAIVFIILGISLEFIAKAYVRRRRLRRKLLDVEHEPMLGSMLALGDTDVDTLEKSSDTFRLIRGVPGASSGDMDDYSTQVPE